MPTWRSFTCRDVTRIESWRRQKEDLFITLHPRACVYDVRHHNIIISRSWRRSCSEQSQAWKMFSGGNVPMRFSYCVNAHPAHPATIIHKGRKMRGDCLLCLYASYAPDMQHTICENEYIANRVILVGFGWLAMYALLYIPTHSYNTCTMIMYALSQWSKIVQYAYYRNMYPYSSWNPKAEWVAIVMQCKNISVAKVRETFSTHTQ